MVDKLIVTNRAALRTKYGARGLVKVTAAVKALIAADRKRGLVTRLIALDSAAMKRYGSAVTDASSARQNKRAIDSLYRALRPHYLMILGSIDVIPHQDPKNPVYADDQEDDPVAWGDLPYACDAPYSRDITKFIGPTRVIGRLPDMTGASEPSHLLACLQTAVTYKQRPLAQYLDYFALSVQLWKKSSALSLANIFGNARKLLLAPPTGSVAASRKLGPRSHFINCHGALADPRFYGEDKKARRSPWTRRTCADGFAKERWRRSNVVMEPSCTTRRRSNCLCRFVSLILHRARTDTSAARRSRTARPKATAPPT